MDATLDTLFDFMAYSARLREVTRHNNASAERKESVAEHSWHVALLAWLFKHTLEKEFACTLDTEKMIKMALMHDLVEIDAGDPSAWSKRHDEGKAQREDAVAQARFGGLPELLAREFLSLWHEYEAGQTLESKVVRGIDRLNPALMRQLSGQGWTDVHGNPERLDELQLPRLEFSQTLLALYERVKADAVRDGLL